MANDNLKNGLRNAGLTPEAFAAIIQVDPKSVGRWVTGNTTPYPKHRAAISRALNLAEHDLWPDQTTDASAQSDTAPSERPCDVTGTWGHADDPTGPDLVAFITDSTGPLDVLDSCCGINITADIIDALIDQADAGRPIRILTDGQAPYWEQLLDHQQIELYLADIPGEYWLIQTSDRMLLTINLEHDPGERPPPILELATASGNGLFERLTSRFDELWQTARETNSPDTHGPPPGAAPPDPEREPGPGASAEMAGRRWPRQPSDRAG